MQSKHENSNIYEETFSRKVFENVLETFSVTGRDDVFGGAGKRFEKNVLKRNVCAEDGADDADADADNSSRR